MIRLLIKKELLSLFKQPYLFLLISILIVLFVVAGVTSSGYYSEHREYYNRYGNSSGESYPQGRFIYYPPNEAFFICSDSQNTAKTHLRLSVNEFNIFQNDADKRNPYLPLDFTLDWTFIIQIFVSIFALLLSYNSFSDEIEQGTLALVSSNSVSRLQLFLGKFITYFLFSAVALSLWFLADLVTVQIIGIIPLHAGMIIQFLLFLSVSLLYAGFFILIGMSISLLTRRSTISLIVSVTVWLILVILLPECAEILIKKAQKDPSDFELTQQFSQIWTDYIDRSREIGNVLADNQPYSDEELQLAIQIAQEKLRILDDDIVPRSQKTSDFIWLTRRTRAEERRQWKLISPSILYRDISEKILYAGNYRFIDFFKQTRQFWFGFVEDMEQKYGKYYQNPGVYIDNVWLRFGIGMPDYQYNGMEFNLRTPSIWESLNRAASSIIALMLLAFGVGIWGFISFVKCDVRSK